MANHTPDTTPLVAKLVAEGVFDRAKVPPSKPDTPPASNPPDETPAISPTEGIIQDSAYKEWEDAKRIITMIASGQDPYEVGLPLQPRTLVSAETVKAMCIVLAKLIESTAEKPQLALVEEPLAKPDYSHVSAFDNVDLPTPETFNLEELVAFIEFREVTQSLEKVHGNQTAAARDLGITLRALRYRLEQADAGPPPQAPFNTSNIPPRNSAPLDNYLARIEKNIIVAMCRRTRNNVTEAARRLGVTYRALRYRIERLEIDV